MQDELDLFGEALARSTDPGTSHAAAEAVEGTTAARMERKVLEGLAQYPDGLTCHELVEVTGIPYESVTPRIKPLRAKNLVLDSGLRRSKPGSNRLQIVWIRANPAVDTAPATNRLPPVAGEAA